MLRHALHAGMPIEFVAQETLELEVPSGDGLAHIDEWRAGIAHAVDVGGRGFDNPRRGRLDQVATTRLIMRRTVSWTSRWPVNPE